MPHKLLVCDVETSFSPSPRAASRPPQNSRRHRRGTGCAAVPHPSTTLPPRKTARSDALTIEMSALEARPPTAPESWLLSGIGSPPLGSKLPRPCTQHHRRDQRETPHRTPPGHRPPTRRTLPGPLTERPTHRSRIGRFDTWFRRQHTLWSRLHSPAGGDKFARLILRSFTGVRGPLCPLVGQ